MSTMTAPAASAPKRPTGRTIQIIANQPDPRPVTDYTVAYEDDGFRAKLTITLAQPCVIRSPKWQVIDAADGSLIEAEGLTIETNTVFTYLFEGLLPDTACMLQAPCQDTEVQNFQGGFVTASARWFRAPK